MGAERVAIKRLWTYGAYHHLRNHGPRGGEKEKDGRKDPRLFLLIGFFANNRD